MLIHERMVIEKEGDGRGLIEKDNRERLIGECLLDRNCYFWPIKIPKSK
jgi:hypothetical protein